MEKKIKKLSPKKSRGRLYFLFGAVVVFFAFLGFIIHLDITRERQKEFGPFYTPPSPLSGKPGDIIRTERLGINIPNAKAYRILYRSELATGEQTAVSGMLFVPDTKIPGGGRPVVAWAHGTLGMGDGCAPSRSANPIKNLPWISEMLAKGWIVTATDYYGLGTPGTERYLLGEDEARDVLNSVRAAKNFTRANASDRFAVFGHSQGGHSALFTVDNATWYTPELSLVGVVAAAPAAELSALMDQQYDSAAAWVVGPEMALSWSTEYKDLSLATSLTEQAFASYSRLAKECVSQSGIEGIVRSKIGEQFFAKNPTTLPSWYAAMQKQTPVVPSAKLPVLIAQGLADTIVLPNTTALFVKRSCDADANITTHWLPGIGHLDLPDAAGPYIISWISERFAQVPTSSGCDQPLPIQPADDPKL